MGRMLPNSVLFDAPFKCYPEAVRDIPGKSRLPELDAMRGMAALAVVFFHLSVAVPAAPSALAYGVTGVDLFFMISGFVILMTLEEGRGPGHFLFGRFSRLYPAYWASVLFTASLIVLNVWLSPGSQGLDPFRFLANLSMFQFHLHQADLDGSYWTLIIELSFYAMMLALSLIKALGRVELLGALALPFAFLFSSDAFTSGYQPLHDAFVNRWPLVAFFPLFLAGIVFYRIHREGASLRRYALLAACFAAQVALLNEGGISRYWFDQWKYAGALAVYFALFLVFTKHRLGLLVNPVTLFLGNISFSLYLCHQYLSLNFIIPHLTSRGVSHWTAAGAALIASILVAAALTWKVERPAMIGMRAWYARKTFPSNVKFPDTRLTDR